MFKDYTELVEPLRLPIKGKVYEIPEPSIDDGVQLASVLAALQNGEEVTDFEDETFQRALLGPVYDEMIADKVPGGALMRVTLTALADFQRGRATAEIIWETGGDPKAIAAKVAPKTRGGGASTTPRRASTSGTRTTRKK